jgi:hypothetical protein
MAKHCEPNSQPNYGETLEKDAIEVVIQWQWCQQTKAILVAPL